jgi:hypothetical protein
MAHPRWSLLKQYNSNLAVPFIQVGSNEYAGYAGEQVRAEFTAPESSEGLRSVVRYRRKNKNMINAAAKIEITNNRRTNRLFALVCLNFRGRWVCLFD